jgi:hypothetical protein
MIFTIVQIPMKGKTRPSGANLDRAALAHAEEMTRPTYCRTKIFFVQVSTPSKHVFRNWSSSHEATQRAIAALELGESFHKFCEFTT